MNINPAEIEDCHWLPTYKGPKRVIVKFSKRKDANSVRRAKKNLKGMDLSSLGITSPVYINDSLCQYYKTLWKKCKKLWSNKYITSFWVSNGSIRLKVVENGNPRIISHNDDLEKLFPGNHLLRDDEPDV